MYYFGSNVRNEKELLPSLKCPQENDLYTLKNSNKGNQMLTYPIGLITIDELRNAGAYKNFQSPNYLLGNNTYWTISPLYSTFYASEHFGDPDYNYTYYFGFRPTYGISLISYEEIIGVRPVINLRADIKLTGTGTMKNPYVVEGVE